MENYEIVEQPWNTIHESWQIKLLSDLNLYIKPNSIDTPDESHEKIPTKMWYNFMTYLRSELIDPEIKNRCIPYINNKCKYIKAIDFNGAGDTFDFDWIDLDVKYPKFNFFNLKTNSNDTIELNNEITFFLGEEPVALQFNLNNNYLNYTPTNNGNIIDGESIIYFIDEASIKAENIMSDVDVRRFLNWGYDMSDDFDALKGVNRIYKNIENDVYLQKENLVYNLNDFLNMRNAKAVLKVYDNNDFELIEIK